MRRGVSLVEVLVVVAIVAILGALLLPVLTQSRELSRRTACAANLRQIGAAVHMYVDDHDGVMPLPRINAPRLTWAALVQPYVRNWGLFRCPNMVDARFAGRSIWEPPLNLPGNLSMWPGFGWNVDYLAYARSDCSDFNRAYPGSGPPTAMALIAQPAATVMCVGISLAPGPGSWAGQNSLYPEFGGYFLAPAPASVGGTDTCTFPYAGWGAGSYLGPFGGFEAPRHGGRGNVLFVDGHLRSMTPAQLAAGTNWTPTTPNRQITVVDRAAYLWDLQ